VTRGFIGSLLGLCFIPLLLTPARAAGPASTSAAALQRFLSLDDPAPTQYRALRHLEARNDTFEKSAWMDVWTEGDASGFRYLIVSEDGSDYIRSKVFRATLDTERKMWASRAPDRAALTPANYVFEDGGAQPDGLASLTVKPRRKDVLLVDGSIFLNPEDGELVRMEGRLSKAPSFWTRRVEIVRWYQRIAGFRMPTALESVANVRVAGVSTFRMSYDYESINGQRVGNPQPRVMARNSSARPQP
jgi:hypothetical protein